MTPRIWITRPEPGATHTASLLAQAGFETRTLPLLNIEPTKNALITISLEETRNTQAIALTSQHALSGVEHLPDLRRVPVFAVGVATAEKARRDGFVDVTVCEGHATALLHRLTERCPPDDGNILYLRGEDITLDIRADLTAKGFTVLEAITYKAAAITALPSALIEEISRQHLHAVTAYSQRTLKILESLIVQHHLQESTKQLQLVCLSPTIAEIATHTLWQKVPHAEAPHQAAMLKTLKRLYGEPPRITT